MNKELCTLINNFQSTPSVNAQKDIEDFYIKNYLERESIQKDLLAFFKSDETKDKVEWHVFFHFDSEFWVKTYLVEQEKKAEECLIFCKEMKGQDVFIEMNADLGALFYQRALEELGEEVSDQIEKIWLNTFSEFPSFEKTWSEHKVKHQELEKECLAETEENIGYETIQTLEIKVPVDVEMSQRGKINHSDIHDAPEYLKFMSDRIDYFNQFNLQSYMDIDACHSVSMRVEDMTNIFTLELHEEVDANELRKALLGQLSDGLGSNLSQRPLLIKDKIYFFNFDCDNAGLFETVSPSTSKFKI